MIINSKTKPTGEYLEVDNLQHLIESVEEKDGYYEITVSDIGGDIVEQDRTVEINGKVFDVSDKSMTRISMAIQASELAGIKEHKWKLSRSTSGERIQVVGIDELKQALMMGLQKIATEVL